VKTVITKIHPVMRRILKILLIAIAIPALVLAMLIIYASITNYNPPESEVIPVDSGSADILADTAVYKLMIWNIGYAGLDKSMDFFYDGGEGVRTKEGQLHENLSSINHFLKNTAVDFCLLQEVDLRSHRSYRTNQVAMLSETMGCEPFLGSNYDVFFVPLPFSNPLGAVNSGILSLSRLNPVRVERISFPGQYPWPKQLFMLDRCFLVMHHPVSGGRELLVINTHNEAYDNGSIRDQQMAYLNTYVQEAYRKGNFVVVAGDWNQCPPGFVPAFEGEVFDTLDYMGIDENYLSPDWKWVYDNRVPSNRRLDIPYMKGKTRTTVIDFALFSPNLVPDACHTIDLGFENSDHQPVLFSFTFQ
jgi:endonuclease/exonuclease/phosphatase family metal-dependent hydrolase